jgi:hypothetical protein
MNVVKYLTGHARSNSYPIIAGTAEKAVGLTPIQSRSQQKHENTQGS